MTEKTSFFTIALVSLLLFNAKATASQNLGYYPIDSVSDFQHVADHSLLLEDKDNRYSVEDILSNELVQSKFIEQDMEIQNMGFTSSTYWLRFNLENSENSDQGILIELARPLTNEIELFVFDSDGQLLRKFIA